MIYLYIYMLKNIYHIKIYKINEFILLNKELFKIYFEKIFII